jgi:hypothetical protein
MDINNKQQAVVEFLLLEGCAGEKIVIHLRNLYGSAAYCRVSAFRWISEVRRGNEELRNEGLRVRPHRHKTDPASRPIRQEDLNALLRTIAETLLISLETVRMHMSLISDIVNILHWIPHALTYELEQVRLSMPLQLLPELGK